MGTVLLFDEDAYLTSFEAKVVACQKDDKGNFLVELDQTVFFPEQGGQTSDVGVIEDSNVSFVSIKDGIILHYCDREFSVGDAVTGTIDWEHRFNNMQQHTGEHLFTGLAHNKFGAENVGFHLSDNVVTLDLNIELSEKQIREVEDAANMAIAAGLSIKAWYPKAEELAEISYRSKKEIDGAVRLVAVGDIDVCACCAPHVKDTSQVGILKVQNFERYKGGVRVYILCGLRALDDYRERMEVLSSCSKLFSCGDSELAANISKNQEELKSLRAEVSKLKQQLLKIQVEGLSSEEKNPLLFTEGVDAKSMREVVNGMVENHEGVCGIFCGDDSTGYNYILASRNEDMTVLAATIREKLNGKGGGSKAMIQGQIFSTKEEIGKILNGGDK